MGDPWRGSFSDKRIGNTVSGFLYFIFLVRRRTLFAGLYLFLEKEMQGLKINNSLFNRELFIKEGFYIKKLNKVPAATAEPITPDTFGAIACISR